MNTAIHPFYKIPSCKMEQIINSVSENPNNFTSNNFTICHILCPHEPFLLIKMVIHI